MSTRASTRDRLLDATDEVVFVEGATHAPVDLILERAGVSPATLYRAYGSKEALIAAALDRRHRAWIETWEGAIARASDDRGRLLAVFDALDEFRAERAGARWCAFLGSAAGYVDPPPVLAAAIRQDSDAMRERLRSLAVPLAVPLAGEGYDAVADALGDAVVLLVSGELAVRLRPDPPAPGTARALAELLLEHPGRVAR